MGVYGFISKERSSLWKNALQTNDPMSSTLEGHRNQGEPIIGIRPFVHKDWSRVGHVTQAR